MEEGAELENLCSSTIDLILFQEEENGEGEGEVEEDMVNKGEKERWAVGLWKARRDGEKALQ